MKTRYLAAAVFPLLIGPVVAQEAPIEGAAAEETPVAMSEVVVEEQMSTEVRADWINGATIISPEGEIIGKIVDLILDGQKGTVSAAVVAVGGFLGIGAKQIAVDWNELQINYDGQEITLAMSREEADIAPEYAFRERQNPPAPTPADTGAGTAGGMEAPAAPTAPLE